MRFTASATAQAINKIMNIDDKDKEALLEVITDYFDGDDENSQREVECESTELDHPPEQTGMPTNSM